MCLFVCAFVCLILGWVIRVSSNYSESNLSFEVRNAFDSGEIVTSSVVLDREEAAGVLVFRVDIDSEVRELFELRFSLLVVSQEFLDLDK